MRHFDPDDLPDLDPTPPAEPCRGICEICLRTFGPDDLEDGCTLSANCCGREGLCACCRQEGEHDCDDPPAAGSDQWESTVPTPPDEDDDDDQEAEPGDCEPEDCPACLGNHACDVHGPGPIMPNDRMRIDAAGNVTDAHGRGNL